MDPYEQRLQDKIDELDDDIAEMESSMTRARAQRAAYVDALHAFRQLRPPGDAASAATEGPRGLPDATARLVAIIAVLRAQPEQMMKAGALLESVSERLGYGLSRHHVADLLRSHPERFQSPRRGYWVLTEGAG